MDSALQHIAFIGGGNMASAIIGGLLRQGMTANQITVVEPFADAAARLQKDFGVTVLSAAGPALGAAQLVVWAVKPQVFKEAAAPVASHTRQALHLSVAAGIRTDSICNWLGSDRVVRTMPNTPALVGQGMTALFACAGVSAAEKPVSSRSSPPPVSFCGLRRNPIWMPSPPCRVRAPPMCSSSLKP